MVLTWLVVVLGVVFIIALLIWLAQRGSTHRLKCSFCGKGLIPPRFGPMSSAGAIAMVQKVGCYCDKCNKVACSSCSYIAAETQGKNCFICPSCGKDISESYAQ